MATRLGSRIGRTLLPMQWRGLARDERGATLVEFGLLAPFFFAIVGAILETSVVFLSGQILDSAVQDVGRLIRTGQAQGTIVSDDDFRDEICSRLYGLFPNCDSSLFVDVQTIANFDATSISAPVNWNCTDLTAEECTAWTREPAYTAGDGSSIMLLQVYYKWPLMLSMFDATMSNLPTGERLLGASTVFRNEPFS